MGKRSKESHNKSLSINENDSVKLLGMNMKNNDMSMLHNKNDDSLLMM